MTEVAKTTVTPVTTLDEANPAVVEKVSLGMGEAFEEASKEAIERSEKAAMRAYHENPDPNVPDFDEKIPTMIEEASYMELPILKKKLEAHLRNLDEVRDHLKMYPIYLNYLERQKESGDESEKLKAEEELAIFNALQNDGITMEMQINSFNVKYDVNKRFLEEMIEKIDNRLNNELEELNKLPTSKKSRMTYDLIIKQRVAITESGENCDKRLIWYIDGMLNAYQQRTELGWINEAIAAGHRPRNVVNNYKNICKTGNLYDHIAKCFSVSMIPVVSDETIPTEVYNFFMYYLGYVSQLSDGKAKPDVRKRIFKEKAIMIIQNLGDISMNLYDLLDAEPYTNEDNVKTTHIILDPEELGDAYEDAKTTAGVNYLNRVKNVANQIYAMAFNK